MRRGRRSQVGVDFEEMRDQRVRSRGLEPPEGWVQVRVNRGARHEVLWRCPKVERDISGSWRRCSYVCRKSQTHLSHTHQFLIDPHDDPDLPAEQRQLNDAHNNVFMTDVMHALAYLAGETSISASAICSKSMRDFIVELCKIVSAYKDRNPDKTFEPDKLLRPLNQKTLRQCILRNGRSAFIFLSKAMDSYMYVNIMIDAATVLNMRVVHSTISNPYSGCAPIPVRCTKKEGNEWTTADYVTEISTIIAELVSSGCFIPVAICHDRLSAQATAVRRVLTMLEGPASELNGLIIDVPCLNHLLHNSFTATLKRKEFQAMIDVIKSFAQMLQKREALNILQRKCPLPPATRWLYIADTLGFIVSHVAKIQEFLRLKYVQEMGQEELVIESEDELESYQAATSVPVIVFDLYAALLPFKLVSLCFESEQSRLSDVIAVIRVLQKAVKYVIERQLLTEEISHGFLHELMAQFVSRLKILLPNETWACWSLTREGRYQLRKKAVGHMVPYDAVCDYENVELKRNEAAVSMKKQFLEAMARVQAELERRKADMCSVTTDGSIERNMSDEYREEEAEDERNQPDPEPDSLLCSSEGNSESPLGENQEELSINRQIAAELDVLLQQNLADVLDFDITHDGYAKALVVIQRYFTTLHKDGSQREAQDLFDGWLYSGDLCPPSELNRPTECEVWRHFTKYDNLKRLAVVAFRLISVATSEADVERLISWHRFLVHDRMSRLAPDTLLARLRMKAKALTERARECRSMIATRDEDN